MNKFKGSVDDCFTDNADDSAMKSLYIDTKRLGVKTSLNSTSSDCRQDSSAHVSKSHLAYIRTHVFIITIQEENVIYI